MLERAAGRIEILPGGGIDRFNLRDVLQRTGARQIHLAALQPGYDLSTRNRPHVYFGGSLRPSEEVYEVADAQAIAGMVELCGQ